MSLEQPSLVFPPAIGGVVLPRGDRAAARLGLTLYTASKGWVLAAQRISHALIGVVGPRALPGRRVTLRVAEWEELTASWHGVVGPVRSVAQYQRKDPRAGLLLLLMREHGLPLVVKVRERSDGVVQEQRVLGALQGHHPRGLHVPRPAGHGTTSTGLTWAAQEFVFQRPHRPVLELEDGQADALAEAVTGAFERLGLTEPRQDGWRPAHGDLTPWNLRRDHTGRTWLLDWEDAGYLPLAADETYFAVTASMLRGTTPGPVDPEAAAHWRSVVERRLSEGHPVALNEAMLARLP